MLLAPYNNAMRLGQGFNSFTQQITIDDAVIVSPHRAENFLSNDGQTMRTRQQAEPSLYRSKQEVLVDEDRLSEARRTWNRLKHGMDFELGETRQEEVRAMQRKDASLLTLSNGVNPATPTAPPPYRENASSQGLIGTKTWNIQNIGGPSQDVTFTSRFVDSLSSVVKDMGISASLSIKCGTIAGSGKGSFINSDTFLTSDLNYLIHVRVTNQTTNFKDPLEFNPIKGHKVPESDFLKTYGDSYISGFLEGGEFAAIVSMKVLNTAKMSQIDAAAKVAFGSGALDVEASASFGLAKSNINLNTETTISCAWTGGGVIKPPNEEWNIDSLMRAACRFPENVARSPQRTYAILYKYDLLRSYLALKPETLSKTAYENVASYTDELLDAFMVYKSLLSTLQTDMREIQTGAKRFRPGQEQKEDGFEVSLDGLEEACQQIRPQLNRIVDRVELLEANPDALKDPRVQAAGEPYESPVAFWERLPIVESVKSGAASRPPLTGLRIGPKTSTEDAAGKNGKNPADQAIIANLCESEPASLSLTAVEDAKILKHIADKPKDAPHLMHLTRPVGSREDGEPFFGLDFLKPSMAITRIAVGVANGSIASISVSYNNGLQWRRGRTDDEQESVQLDDFAEGETIVSGTIEFGKPEAGVTKGTVTALQLKTSLGRELNASAEDQVRFGYQCRYLDGKVFTKLEPFAFEPPIPKAVLLGFYGLSVEKGEKAGIHRLGFVWAVKPAEHSDEDSPSASASEPLVGLQHAPTSVSKSFSAALLPSEKSYLTSQANKTRFRGCQFGPCLGSQPNPIGELFNDASLFSALAQGGNDWPSRIIFDFARGPSTLVAVRVYYGKTRVVHGLDVLEHQSGPGSFDSLDIKLGDTEKVTSIAVPSGATSSTALPSGIAIKTDRGRSFAIGAAASAEVVGFKGANGVKGFFGLETAEGLSRLLPVWM